MRVLRPICPAEIKLRDEEATTLEAVPDPSHELKLELLCELEAGHEGPHFSLGQASGTEDEWWLRWQSAEQREIVKVDFCPAEDPEPSNVADPWVCELPADHVGAHSFELGSGPIAITGV